MREVPVVAPIPREGYWVTMDDTKISVTVGNKRYIYIVPVGFITDFASVPRPLWWFVSPTDKTVIRASLLHDYLYRTGSRSRKEADYLFYLKLLEDGTPKWKAWIMYQAVRLFGKRAWGKYRRIEDDTEE